MKNLYKIMYCSALLISQTLSSEPQPAPNWAKPVVIYSTPDTQNNLVNHSGNGAFYNFEIDSNGNATLLLPPLGDSPVSLGISMQVTPNFTTTRPLIPAPLDNSTFQYDYALSVDATNNALAVWKMYDPHYTYGNSSIQSALLTNGIWGAPTTITNVQHRPNGSYLSPYHPQVSLHNDGSGIAVWLEADQSYSNHVIRYNLFDTNGTWQYDGSSQANSGSIGSNWTVSTDIYASNPLLLDIPTGDNNSSIKASCVYQGVDGKIYITKLQKTGSDYSWAAPYTSSQPTTGLFAGAMNANGDSAVAYVNSNSGNVEVYWSVNGGSAESTAIHNFWNPGPTHLAVSINRYNTITVVATINNYDGGTNTTSSSVQVAQYKDGAWINNNNPIILASSTPNISYCNPSITTNSNGNFFAVWEGDNNISSKGSIYFNYWNSYGWTYAQDNAQILSPYSGSFTNPKIKATADTAFVTWIKNGIAIEALTTTQNTYQPQVSWFECVQVDAPL